MPELRTAVRVSPDRRPAAGDRASSPRRSRPATATRRCSARPGTGKTATMAWVIEKLQRPALVIAHNKTLAAQLCNEFREFFPGQRRRVLRLVLRLLPARGVRPAGRSLHREGLVPERRHRAAPARRDLVADHAARRRRRRLRLVHLRPRLAGRMEGPGADPRTWGRTHDREEALRKLIAAQYVRNDTVLQRGPLPGQGRRRRGAAGELGDRVPGLVLRRRGRGDHALRPAHRRGALQARQPRHLARDRVRHVDAVDRARDRRDPARARAAGGPVRGGGPDARGAPDPPAHRVRHGDAEGARLLQRDRELLAHPRGPAAGLAPVHADRLLPRRLRRLRRRVAPDRAPDRRHVRGRPLAQADARRLRLPAAVGARQPPAPLRRVPRQGQPARLRLGDARARSSSATRPSSPSS